MNSYAAEIKSKLETVIEDVEKEYTIYVKNPKKDFSRDRKLNFKEMIRILLSMNGKTLSDELIKYFSYDIKYPTNSAFIQQRDKILPEVFEKILKSFTELAGKINKYNGYRLLAVDGSNLAIAHNPKDEKTYFPNKTGKGCNSLQLNMLYDLCNKICVDAIIQNGREMDEREALIDMVKSFKSKEKAIFISDRGYESYNVIENIRQKELDFLIRIKDINSNGISSGLILPEEDIFDIDINLLLTRRQTNEIKLHPEKYKFMPNNQRFDFILPNSKGTYPINFRIVRFPIGENSYEVLVTSLSKEEFPIEKLKELYHMRWGIETAFRELKYAIGLTSFNSKKVEYIKQEIFAKLTMYNFCEIITLNVVVQKKDRKHNYQVNFTIAISICLQYFKSKPDILPINVEALIQKNLLPVRNGRKEPRKLKSKSTVSFLYRIA